MPACTNTVHFKAFLACFNNLRLRNTSYIKRLVVNELIAVLVLFTLLASGLLFLTTGYDGR